MAKRSARSRKHNQDPEDAFIAKILELTHWSQSHQQVLAVVGLLVVGAIGMGVYYHKYEESLSKQAEQSMQQIQQSMLLKDSQGAKTKLATFLQRFGGTPYAGQARLLLGQIYLQANQPKQAVAVLKPIGASPSAPIDFQAAQLLGVAYEQEKQWNEAEQTYLKVANGARLDFEVREALASAARIRAQQGNKAGAVELYKRILSNLGGTDPNRAVYQMRIDELTAKPIATVTVPKKG